MNKRNLIASLLITAGLIASGCAANPADNVPKAGVNTPNPASTPVAVSSGTPAPVADGSASPSAVAGQLFTLSEATEVKFIGSKVTGSHDGGFRKVSGTVTVPEQDLTRAVIDVTIDMASTYSDNEKLTEHLLSADFFEVATYPTSTFKSTAINKTEEGYQITGDMTLHGVTQSLTIPAQMSLNGNELTASSEFQIDRYLFKIEYPGKQDDLIRKEVVIKLDIKASAAG
jgi:polyisoprenoid-binding protein YceI